MHMHTYLITYKSLYALIYLIIKTTELHVMRTKRITINKL